MKGYMLITYEDLKEFNTILELGSNAGVVFIADENLLYQKLWFFMTNDQVLMVHEVREKPELVKAYLEREGLKAIRADYEFIQ